MVGTWSSLRKSVGLFPQGEVEGGPNLRVVEEGNEVQPGEENERRMGEKFHCSPDI